MAVVIMVVDDDSDCLAALTSILNAEGFRVRPANSGSLALASIAAIPPELILLDVRMPGMDGFEVCRRIKARKESQNIPIVFLSAAHEVEERVEGLKLGAVDFLSKPFQRDELLARVRTHLELSRLRAELEMRVAERTAELRAANAILKAELVEHARNEQMLRASEETFRDLADRAPVAIWVMGPDGGLLFHNKRGLAFAGRTMRQLMGSGWTTIVHPEDLEGVQAKHAAAVEGRRAFRIECRVRGANGAVRWVLHTGIPRFIGGVFQGHIGTTIDITDLKRSHERTVVAEKLASLGSLSAGIAHDFNNLVGSIFAASDLALSDLPVDSPARESIERIHSVAMRASEIVNLLMSYAGENAARVDRIDLSLVVAEMLELVKGTISPKIALDVQLASGLPEVRANVTQIRQVILNLVMNASESLEHHEGIVTIRTGWISGSRQGDAESDGEGGYCRLVVSDTGCGMTPEVRARVFDPFYSTKFIGRGLGLAVVHGIVRSLGGTVNVTTTPGAGSMFEVLLPCAKRAEEHLPLGQAAAGGEFSLCAEP